MSNSNDDPLGRAGPWKVPPPDKAPATTPSSNKSDSELGEFTRMFEAPDPARAPEAVPEPDQEPPQKGAEPGEFTRMFSTTSISREAAPPPPQPFEPRPQGAGEFTRIFQTVDQPFPETPIQAPSPPQATNEAATGIFRPAVAPPEPTIQQPAGVSEFTRVFAVPTPPPAAAAPEAPKAPEAPADQPAPAAKPSYLPLILILNALFIAVIVVVLYFALKK